MEAVSIEAEQQPVGGAGIGQQATYCFGDFRLSNPTSIRVVVVVVVRIGAVNAPAPLASIVLNSIAGSLRLGTIGPRAFAWSSDSPRGSCVGSGGHGFVALELVCLHEGRNPVRLLQAVALVH